MLRAVRCLPVLALLSLSGCAITEARIDLHYQPLAAAQPVPGAPSLPVSVDVRDGRNVTDRVGNKINTYGMQMAAIKPNQDLASFVQASLESELRARGFPIVPGGVSIHCDIHDFYNRFVVGDWSGTSVANVQLDISVRDRNGMILFSDGVIGSGDDKVMWATGGNARSTLDLAFAEAMGELFRKQAFYDAIRKASARPR